jgi:hypothetical protein
MAAVHIDLVGRYIETEIIAREAHRRDIDVDKVSRERHLVDEAPGHPDHQPSRCPIGDRR